jgi:hypothetical protein
VRDPWFAVPDVRVPDGFLGCMSGTRVALIENAAHCVATNSLHVVTLRAGRRGAFAQLQRGFASTLSELSCELEGHPLGGGMLKVEPREAQRLLIPGELPAALLMELGPQLADGIATMRRWRHCS